MYDIPEQFRDIPEAARLRRADADFCAALQDERRSIGQAMALRGTGTGQTGERVRLASAHVRRCQDALKQAQQSFDEATGEPKPPGLTPAVVTEVRRQFPDGQQQEVLELLDRSCGRTLPFFRDATAQKLERIRLCALKVARGEVVKLRQAVELANIDWRDLISAAESQ